MRFWNCLFGWRGASCCFVFVITQVQAAPPLGLPPVPVPANNLGSPAQIALGQQLYFEARLSSDGKVSCASCHDPAKGFSNGEQFATGIDGKVGGRNSPTIINAAYQRFQFWDGRASSLEEQSLGPIQNPIEMNMPLDQAVAKLNSIEGYRQQFQAVFGSPATPETIGKAIAAYERTVLSGNAPYDRFRAGDRTALSDAVQRGMQLFFGKAHCSACHTGPNFTDDSFHNIGIESGDEGRKKLSQLTGDTGSFKTPTLREISKTAPYMHNGSLKTLEEVMTHYNKGGTSSEFQDEEIYPLKLSPEEVEVLITFLKEGLSSSEYPAHTAPVLPE